MQGYIDRLDKIGDGHLSVHDYKTSNRVPPQAKADQDRQLGLYALAVHQKYPDIKKIDLVWHYVRFDEEVRSSRTQQMRSTMRQPPSTKTRACGGARRRSLTSRVRDLHSD